MSLQEPKETSSEEPHVQMLKQKETKPSCHPRTKFAFIQTHRTGSETQANVLYRAALKYNLFVLPFDGACFTKRGLAHPDCPLAFLSDIYYSRLAIPDVYIGKRNFDDGSLLKTVVPNGTMMITSMRSPKEQEKSHFAVLYSNINTTDSQTQTNIKKGKPEWQYWTQLCNNSKQYHELLKDCSTKNEYTRKCFTEACTRVIQKRFQLVTITDYFDESLIMLKRRMCWTHEDVVYSPLNVRNTKQKVPEKLPERNHKENEIDTDLFDKSNETLWKEIKKENSDFIKETKHLKKIQYVTTQFCDIIYSSLKTNLSTVYEVIVSDKEVPIPRVKWDPGFKLTPMLCVLIKLKPQIFRNVFIVRMFPEVCKFVPPDNEAALYDFKVQYERYNEPVVYVHSSYCSPLQTKYRIPLQVLEHPDAYDLKFSGVQRWQAVTML